MKSRAAGLYVCALIIASTIGCATVPPTDEPGRLDECHELVGYWKVLPLKDRSINEVDPWPLPYQWFAFYEDGRVASMMKTDDANFTRSELEDIFALTRDNAPTYFCEDGWLVIEYEELPGVFELWGKNIFTRRAGLQNPVPFEPGDIMLTLAAPDDRRMIYFRPLRRVH